MERIGIFMANGCEEIEGLTVVDVLRRAEIPIDMIAIADSRCVQGSHGIEFVCEKLMKDVDFDDYAGLVLPGGMPGTLNLGADETVVKEIKAFVEAGKLVAAICAAPSVLGDNGILDGKKATCHPGFEERLTGASVVEDAVAVDGNVITSRGMATAIDFALAIVDYVKKDDTAEEIRKAIVYQG